MWKSIRGYKGFYEVNELGDVRSIKQRRGTHAKLLKPTNMKGYRRVDLCVDMKRSTKMVHRLVAEAFLLNPKNLPYINHIDCNKANNLATNLEWCSHQENMNHAWKTGLMAKVGQYVPR